jgi:hypothetical protein
LSAMWRPNTSRSANSMLNWRLQSRRLPRDRNAPPGAIPSPLNPSNDPQILLTRQKLKNRGDLGWELVCILHTAEANRKAEENIFAPEGWLLLFKQPVG